MTRISVLSNAEVKEFDDPPIFNSVDRKCFYHMTMTLQNALNRLRTPTNKVYFLVSYAYFKAKKRFYGGKFLAQDIEYACRLLDINIKNTSLSSYSRKIRLEHQTIILDIYSKNYKDFFNNYCGKEVFSVHKNNEIIREKQKHHSIYVDVKKMLKVPHFQKRFEDKLNSREIKDSVKLIITPDHDAGRAMLAFAKNVLSDDKIRSVMHPTQPTL